MNLIKRIVGSHKTDVDMTDGSIAKHLINFAIPLLIGNIFQQLYNTVDAWVVGNFVSKEAFAAVGSVGPITNLLIGFFMGLSNGAGVVISQFYGAKDDEKVRSTVNTAFIMTLVLAVIFTFVGILYTPYALTFMETPEDVFPESRAYLTIYFAGIIGLMVYNMGAGILRAVGDSTLPFIFLVISASVNTVLDLLFVLGFGMGVEGVAIATVIAQGVSAILVIITMMRSKICIKLDFRRLSFDLKMFMNILKIGIPTAIQLALTSFSNIFVQSYINYFGSDCMSGWTAYGKIDQLVLLPMQSISLASTTFVGQNLGKYQVDRAKKGVKIAIYLAMLTTVICMIPVMLFAPYLVSFFNSEPGVIEYGSKFLIYISPFYVLCCINQICAGALRGAGHSRAPMLITLASFVFFRQIYLYIMANYISNTVIPISMGYPAGWLVCSALMLIYFNKVDLSAKVVVK